MQTENRCQLKKLSGNLWYFSFVNFAFNLLYFNSHLSHEFHGKGSGKLKSEKRAKKEEDKMVGFIVLTITWDIDCHVIFLFFLFFV